jgi:Ohr subfamily peroxiredoxin
MKKLVAASPRPNVDEAVAYVLIHFQHFPKHAGYADPSKHSLSPDVAQATKQSDATKECSMTKIDTVLYTGKTHTTGGREGFARSDDAQLDIRLSPPGSGKPGTNPEQLFAAGWSACFIGAMTKAAGKRQLRLPAETAVNAEVDLGTTDGAYFLQARLAISLPGIDPELARAIVEDAHQTCPYSKATRGNIAVELTLV